MPEGGGFRFKKSKVHQGAGAVYQMDREDRVRGSFFEKIFNAVLKTFLLLMSVLC